VAGAVDVPVDKHSSCYLRLQWYHKGANVGSTQCFCLVQVTQHVVYMQASSTPLALGCTWAVGSGCHHALVVATALTAASGTTLVFTHSRLQLFQLQLT